MIYACKPRFPTLLLASLIKDQCEAPVILHVDDLELGLVGATAASSLAELETVRHHDPAAFIQPRRPCLDIGVRGVDRRRRRDHGVR